MAHRSDRAYINIRGCAHRSASSSLLAGRAARQLRRSRQHRGRRAAARGRAPPIGRARWAGCWPLFYWAYAPMQPVMGWCADRFGPARVLAGGLPAVEPRDRLGGLRGRARRAGRAAAADGRRRSDFLPERPQPVVAQRRADAARPRDGDDAVRRACSVQRSARCSAGSSWYGYGWRAMFVVMGLASLVWLVFWRRWMRSPQRHGCARCAGRGRSAVRG